MLLRRLDLLDKKYSNSNRFLDGLDFLLLRDLHMAHLASELARVTMPSFGSNIRESLVLTGQVKLQIIILPSISHFKERSCFLRPQSQLE